MQSHASNCCAIPLDDDAIRIYFSTRDALKRSSVASLDYSMRERRVIRIADDPVLAPGRRGAFDDSGVSAGWIVRDGPQLLLYYLGWNLGVTVPFRNSIGLAISDRGSAFERISEAPILDRNQYDPFSLSYPCVLRRGANDWLMWYGSNLDWETDAASMRHEIKLAQSSDGRRWSPTGKVCIGVQGDDIAFSRPSVEADGGVYRMWYSVRGAHYRIGYAESRDGVDWNRLDEAGGLQPSGTGWDADEVEYPNVFRFGGDLYMLYCGDGYGATGFGLAVRRGQ